MCEVVTPLAWLRLLCLSLQVMEFLSPDSDLYDTEDEPGFLKSLGAQMLNANLNMK